MIENSLFSISVFLAGVLSFFLSVYFTVDARLCRDLIRF